jgi:hypothetical protein
MICPYCKETIADGAIKCKHCQTLLSSNSNESDISIPRRPYWGSVLSFILASILFLFLLLALSEELDPDGYFSLISLSILPIVIAAISLANKHKFKALAITSLILTLLTITLSDLEMIT